MAPNTQATFHPRMHKTPPFTYPITTKSSVSGETPARRNIRCKTKNNGELVNSPHPSIKTAYDLVTYAAEKFGDAPCIGTRSMVRVHTEEKMVKKIIAGEETEVPKEWMYFELSPYAFLSYREFEARVGALGAGLRAARLGKGGRVVLYGATSMNWFSMAHGAFTQSMTIVTVYDTLGLEGLRSALKQTESKAIFVDSGLLPILNKALNDAPSIQHIILNNESTPNPQIIDNLKRTFPSINILPFDDLKRLGEESPSDHIPPDPEDLACIMYTSGTSGAPKGVTIKHKAIIASVAGANSIVGDYVGSDDRLLAYLPQAHIIEFVIENGTFFWGIPMGYGSPKTLTDTSVRNCKGDLLEFCPTILVGVPAVWETIKKGITTKVNAGGAIARLLFWGALAAKQAFLAADFILGVKLLDAIVFDKVRAATGGKLRFCMSGGGPVARDTQRFISMAIRPLISGYGLTETGGMGALNDPLAWTSDAVGDIPACVEVKLVDYAAAGYFSSNNPPQGEILIRGAAVTERYYDNDAETAAAIRDDGWFLTGDIGEFDGNGHLRLIDRKKNLVKTLNGEYIALEKLEAVYRASPLVLNVCVYAAPDRRRPIAIVVPVEAALMRVARENGFEGLRMEELIGVERVRGIVLAELQGAGRQGGLAGFEIVEGVVLDGEEWTPLNGFETAARKLQRKKILERHKEGVEKAYSKA